MFVSDQLIYLELHKTGSSYVRFVLSQYFGGQLRGKHNRADDSLLRSGRLVAGSVRNPWDWYVSLWAFGTGGKGALWRSTTRPVSPGSLVQSFRSPRGRWQPNLGLRIGTDRVRSLAGELRRRPDSWRGTYADVSSPQLFRAWLGMLLVSNRSDARQGYSLSPVSRYVGLMSYRYASLYWRDSSRLFGRKAPRTSDDLRNVDEQENVLSHTIRLERMDADIEALFSLLGAESQPPLAAPINTSSHAPTAYYYDEKAIELVRSREALIIEKYGYAAPSP